MHLITETNTKSSNSSNSSNSSSNKNENCSKLLCQNVRDVIFL